MKGLLYKDFCQMKKYCRSYLIIIILFLSISLFNKDNMFFVFYPCLIVGMIPTNLLSYDERSKWVDYCKVLPYSASDIVTSKYLIGLITTFIVVLVNCVCQCIVGGGKDMLLFCAFMITISLVISSIPLTFMFRFGVEKGRIAYYIMIGFFTALSFLFANIIDNFSMFNINEYLLSTIMIVGGVLVYILMWRLSVTLYEKNK